MVEGEMPGRIKGVAFGEFLNWYSRRHGSAAVDAAVLAVEARFGEGLDARRPSFGVLASHWYPAELVHDLLDRLTGPCSPAELDAMALEAANFIMGRNLKGVYRTVFKMFATPERYLRYAGKLWSMYYDTGRLIVSASEPRVHRVMYADWTSHHPFICRMNMAASHPIYDAMGCRGVTHQRLRCVLEGDADCENLVRWEA
jgi:hypothetical protein